MNNISVVRNPDTLEILGFAPIYDSGNSMFYNIPYEQLGQVRLDNIRTNSFVEREVRLLSYVKNRRAVDLDKTQVDFRIYEKDLKELSECVVGLIGYGDIARQTARLAAAFGAEVLYYKPSGREADSRVQEKIVFSPHIAGVTQLSFRRGYKMIWENIKKIEKGEEPDNRVWK